jgi:hypothetical protein
MFHWPQESSLRVKNLLDKSASIRFRQNQLQQRCYKNASAAAAEVGAAIARRMNERRLMCDNAKLQVGSPLATSAPGLGRPLRTSAPGLTRR